MDNEEKYINSGILYENRNKRKDHPKDPPLTGKQQSICPKCKKLTKWFTNCWIHDGPKGEYMTYSLKENTGDAKGPAREDVDRNEPDESDHGSERHEV